MHVVASAVTCMADGSAVESAIVALDGVVGVQLCLRQNIASTHTIVQIPGKALHMRRDDFRQELHHNPQSRRPMRLILLNMV